jgi:quercetin dioxygenase-like cupin family protein
MRLTVTCAGVMLAGLAAAAIVESQMPGGQTVVPASQVKFGPIEVPGFDPGLQIAVLHGDPNAKTGTYVIRLSFPDGYRFPPHWHPMAENLTVLQGQFSLGMGETRDDSKLSSYSPGSFLHIPPKMAHFGTVKGATTVQLHGEAPFAIELAKAGMD